jgi:hypothetical protein
MQLAVSCPFAAETEVFENLYLDLRLFNGWAAAHFLSETNKQCFHSRTGEKLARPLQKKGSDNLAAN